ncbi:MAG TPA: dipeptidase [Gemmataceae bacterium]|jgi:membrane dipeptidase
MRIFYLSLALIVLLSLLGQSISAEEEKTSPPSPKSRDPVKLTDEALRIHREALLIDGHNDLPWQFREKRDLSFRKIDLRKSQKELKLHTDIPRLIQGGVGAQFWSAYVPADTAKKGTAVRMTLEQIDVIKRMVAAYPDTFEMAYSADDIVRIRKKGKIASLIGVEGGHSIDNSLGVLRMLHELGVCYMTLTHSETLDWADSATDTAKHHGLTAFGEQVVQEMNRLGMLVDISHVSAETMRHALRVTRAPLIASHSSAYALADHPRNVPDDVLRLVKKNGGVVMVNFYSGFIVPEAVRLRRNMFQVVRDLQKKYPDEREFQAALRQWRKENPIPAGSVHTVVDHIEHIIQVAGVEHVGLGSDFDGIGMTPKQLDDVSCYPYITQELLNRGHSKEDILKILGGNVLRVLRQAEQVAKKKP